MAFTPADKYIKGDLSLDPEDESLIVTFLDSVNPEVNQWFAAHVANATVHPENTPESDCLGEDHGLIHYTPVIWSTLSQSEKDTYFERTAAIADMRGEDVPPPPSDDHVMYRTTINTGHIVDFVKRHTTSKSYKAADRQKLVLFILMRSSQLAQEFLKARLAQEVYGTGVADPADEVLEGEVYNPEGEE